MNLLKLSIPHLYENNYTDKVESFLLVFNPLSKKGLSVLNKEAAYLFGLIDGKKTMIIPSGKLKLISFDVPAGTHLVEVAYVNTRIRTGANTLSLLTLLSVLSYYVLLGLKKRQLR